MAIYEVGQYGSITKTIFPQPSSEQLGKIEPLNEQFKQHPDQVALVTAYDVRTYKRDGIITDRLTTVLDTDYLGIIAEGFEVETDGTKITFPIFPFATNSHLYKPNVYFNELGSSSFCQLDLAALDRPLSKYAGDDINRKYRHQPALKVFVGDEAVKVEIAKREAMALKKNEYYSEWWKKEEERDKLLIGFGRLQNALGRLVVDVPDELTIVDTLRYARQCGPLQDPTERAFLMDWIESARRFRKLNEVLAYKPTGVHNFFNPNITEETKVGINEAKSLLVGNGRIAVKAGLTTSTREYRELVNGQDDVTVLSVKDVSRNLCELAGVEYPKS